MSASLSDHAPPAYGGGNIFDTLVDDLQSEVTTDGKSRISQVRDLVERMNDVERLLLYLQLPNGVARSDACALAATGALQLSNQLEQSQAFTWIQSHLEEDPSICLRKDEVFNDYRSYCDSHGQKALNTADFGKVMKRAFPNVKPRRLGQRGQSKYCYGGLRKKTDLPHPVMPDLSMAELDCPGSGSGAGSGGCVGAANPAGGEDSVSGEIILEWAQKILGCQFRSLRQLAEHLVTNVYVNSRSPAAMTLVSSLQASSQRRMPVSQLIGLRQDVKLEASSGGGGRGSVNAAGNSACWSPDSLNSSGPLDTSSLASPAPPSRQLLMPLPQRITKKTFRNPAHPQPPQQQQQQHPLPMLQPQQHQLKQPPPIPGHHPQSPSVSTADTPAVRSMQQQQPSSAPAASVPLPRSSSAASNSSQQKPPPPPASSSLNPSPGKKVCSERRFQPLGVPLNPQVLEQEVSNEHYIPLMSPLPSQHHRGGSPAPHWGPPAAACSPPPPPLHHHHQAASAYGIEPISLPPVLGRSPGPQFPPASPEQYLPALPRIGTSPLPSNVTRPLARRSPVGPAASPASRSTMSSASSPHCDRPDSGKTFTTLTSRCAGQQAAGIDSVDGGIGRGEENLVSSTTNPHRNLHTPTGGLLD